MDSLKPNKDGVIFFDNIEYTLFGKTGYRRKDPGLLAHDVWNFYNPNDKIEIGDGFDIHHINGNHLDNRIENLQKLTHGEHAGLTSSSSIGRICFWCYPKIGLLKYRQKVTGGKFVKISCLKNKKIIMYVLGEKIQICL